MAGNNETRIVLTAEDKTAAAFGSVSRGLKQMEDQAAMASRALGAIGVTVSAAAMVAMVKLSLIHISEPTRRHHVSRMPSSA